MSVASCCGDNVVIGSFGFSKDCWADLIMCKEECKILKNILKIRNRWYQMVRNLYYKNSFKSKIYMFMQGLF